MKKARTIQIILIPIIIFQIGCLSYLQYESKRDDPISQLGDRHYVRLDSTWTTEQAQALLKVFNSISTKINTPNSVWTLSDSQKEDIKIESQTDQTNIAVKRDIFLTGGAQSNSSHDKRLFYAVVKFITADGTNREALKLILKERYGINVDIASYELLTQNTTRETASHYSDFKNEDLMVFISILEEFPKALQKIPQLRYIICRTDNDIRSPGLAWTHSGYIEFAEFIFGRSNVDDTRRLIAHEKAHFLWSHLFPEQLKQDWAKLGGWYQNRDSGTGWSTTKDRKEFVTDYAYKNNPNEDMADSLAYYLVYPDKLRACNMAKYDFIHERIMLMYGTRYMPPDMLLSK